jgi:hypothetical protein
VELGGVAGRFLLRDRFLTTLDPLCELRQSKSVLRPQQFKVKMGRFQRGLSGYPAIVAQFRW